MAPRELTQPPERPQVVSTRQVRTTQWLLHPRSVTHYCIKVGDKVVYKRFADFGELHKALGKEFKQLPTLPGEHVQEITEYLSALHGQPSLRSSRIFTTFLAPGSSPANPLADVSPARRNRPPHGSNLEVTPPHNTGRVAPASASETLASKARRALLFPSEHLDDGRLWQQLDLTLRARPKAQARPMTGIQDTRESAMRWMMEAEAEAMESYSENDDELAGGEFLPACDQPAAPVAIPKGGHATTESSGKKRSRQSKRTEAVILVVMTALVGAASLLSQLSAPLRRVPALRDACTSGQRPTSNSDGNLPSTSGRERHITRPRVLSSLLDELVLSLLGTSDRTGQLGYSSQLASQAGVSTRKRWPVLTSLLPNESEFAVLGALAQPQPGARGVCDNRGARLPFVTNAVPPKVAAAKVAGANGLKRAAAKAMVATSTGKLALREAVAAVARRVQKLPTRIRNATIRARALAGSHPDTMRLVLPLIHIAVGVAVGALLPTLSHAAVHEVSRRVTPSLSARTAGRALQQRQRLSPAVVASTATAPKVATATKAVSAARREAQRRAATKGALVRRGFLGLLAAEMAIRLTAVPQQLRAVPRAVEQAPAVTAAIHIQAPIAAWKGGMFSGLLALAAAVNLFL